MRAVQLPSFDHDSITGILFATWVTLALVMLTVHLRANTAIKIEVYRYGPTVIGLLFLGFLIRSKTRKTFIWLYLPSRSSAGSTSSP
jgi:hypothetical protein